MSVSSATGNSAGISLRRILPDATFLHTHDVTVRSCAGALGECQQNDLFVAIVQADHDGHEDAVLAMGQGASAVLSERLLPIDSPQCIVKDSRVAYGRICQALAGYPCDQLKTVAVSGTDGKTTTAHLIASIFEQAGKSTGLRSSLHGGPSDLQPSGARLTPPMLAGAIADLVSHGKEYGVVETSSIELAQHHFAGMELDTAIITNMRGNHFGFHHSLKNYRRSQSRLLNYLKPTGVAVLNADDPGTWFVLNGIEQPALTFGIRNEADVRGRIVESGLHEQKFMISAGNDSVMICTRVPGIHHVYNCLAAATTALNHGIDLVTIARGLEMVAELPGRMNLVRCGQSFAVAIDESTTPFRLGVALNTLRKNTPGRVICVFNAPDESDSQTASQFGRIVERTGSLAVITRSVARSKQDVETDYEPMHQVLDGFHHPARARVMPDRIAAIEWALDSARAGDAVLVAGQGLKPIASLSQGHGEVNDKDVCQSWLYGESIPGEGIPVLRPTPAIFDINMYRQC